VCLVCSLCCFGWWRAYGQSDTTFNVFQTCCVTSLLVQVYLCVDCKLLLHICLANTSEVLFALGALKKSLRGPPQLTQKTFFVFTSVHFD
jgi:hypothetical protein